MRRGVPLIDAQREILDRTLVLGSETVFIDRALGRALDETVVSGRTIPPRDNSAMDGYAVRSGECSMRCTLPVAFEVAAGGESERPLLPGESARIFTGASIPAGCDAVVRQEDTERIEDRVKILVAPEAGTNIRGAGRDISEGDVFLEPGAVLRPAHIGMLAGLGRTVVAVTRRPRVAIFSGGDELVEADTSVVGGKIVASNSYAIKALCMEVGADPFSLIIVRDDPSLIEQTLANGISAADVLITTAGVSVGDHDYIREVLVNLGFELHFWGVKMKPGYPSVFGTRGAIGPLVFGLPGNPASSLVTFEQLVRPALRKMSGFTNLLRPRVTARLAERIVQKPGRATFLRVALDYDGSEYVATQSGSQGSGLLTAMTKADGLLVIPADVAVMERGERGTVQILDADFFSRSWKTSHDHEVRSI